ncbi:MAG: S8 family serine peptidase, partial [Promethearchaeota archaeon]
MDENGITSLKAVYEQADLPVTDQASEVLVKVEAGSIRLTIGFHNSYRLSSKLYHEQLITSDGVLHCELDRLNAIVVNVPISSLKNFMEYWKALPSVRYVEVAQVTQVSAVPNDPDWSLQYGPQIIQADLAWDIQMGDPASILVAVIDTGIDYTHPDLVDQYVSGGYDWVFDDTDPMDDHGHGTHCAGIIGATINNSLGIAGVANVSIMTEKVFDSGGFGYDYDAADAIVHATDMGATVLSNSYGFPEPSTALEDAVAYAYANDVVIVVAAGNDASTFQGYPASYPETISVSATDSYDDPAWFTNYGPGIDVAAPGVDIYSTMPVSMGSYGSMSGTSMACPHVAGVVALIRAEFPSWSNEWVREHLRDSADDLGDPGWDDYYGYGRVNAYQAVQPPPDHDLAVSLEAPTIAPVSETTTLNATVSNRGMNTETAVELQLWIDDIMVTNQIYPSLVTWATETLSYSWTPTIEGTYNITAYAVPVPGEILLPNNNATKIVPVAIVTLMTDFEDSLIGWVWDGLWHLVDDSQPYGEAHSPTHSMYYGRDDTGTFNTGDTNSGMLMTPWYQLGSDVWTINFWSWYETEDSGYNFDLKDVYLVMEDDTWVQLGYVSGTMLSWIHFIFDITAYRDLNVRFAFVFDTLDDIANDYRGWYVDDISFFGHASMLSWHDLGVSLEAPNYVLVDTTYAINTTIKNLGTYDETNAELQLWINDIMVANQIYPSLLAGTTETLSYSWTPAVLGTYNVTAYAVPVPSDSPLHNNNYTKRIGVVDAKPYDMFANDPYAWYDAYTNGYNLGLSGDDVSASVALPFSFYFYDTYFSTVYVSSNGWLSFNDTDPYEFVNPSFPTPDYPYAVAPFWEDLQADNNVYIWSTPDFVVIEYHDYYYLGGSPLAGTFEVVFFANGDILFQYQYIDTDWDATVGLNYGLITEFYNAYTNGLSGVTDFALIFLYYDRHDIVPMLETPTAVLQGTSVILNATVINLGNYDETDVELQLWISDSMVANQVYPSLLVDAMETFSYVWTPTIKDTYNITTYVLPVAGEDVTFNNQATEMVYVGESIFEFELGDYILLGYPTPNLMSATYSDYIDPIHVNVTLEATEDEVPVASAWLSVNTMTRLVEGGTAWPAGYDIYYPYQIETDINLGDTINWLTGTGYVDDTVWYDWDGIPLEAWLILLDDLSPGMYAYFHKGTGIMLYYWDPMAAMGLSMIDTNMINLAPTVTVTYPNGGETLSGSPTIIWTATDPDDDPMTFTVYYWDGSSWVELANGLTDTSYEWDTTTVPDGSTYKIRVVASDGALTGEDESDAVFTIDNPDPPTVTVTYPDGGETLSGTVTITWTAS